ncbi:DNA polymerase III subunit delta [Coprobacter tertius]|uniref:DNA polymerase III subunit delta n=1 Tax=Coprobacter tertius TaxID=2944915 RepID=A0ABT1MHJ7_9BACT|nr:DNA polymerase III subunit delta [Coprobacter tertius]MCP9612108.1 DNA polymerase III subunit delta [Coprobacter tertius]
MAKKEVDRHLQIISDIRKKNFKPIYLLMGSEPYFIDMITDEIIANALEDADRDFNQTIVYGADVSDISVIINAAKRYPMMAPRQLVVVKEAQLIDKFDDLLYYVQKPLTSTVLVINYKYNTLKNKKIISEIEKAGVVYESRKLYDSEIPGFVSTYLLHKGISIEAKESAMLCDSIGADLSRLTSEIDKLLLTLPENEKRITAADIEKNIGISKDFNNFELLKAIIVRDAAKANLIIQYFEKNPKTNPLVVTISVLFNFYANLMLLYFIPDKSPTGIMSVLKLKSSFQTKDYITALRNYNAFKCIEIISQIRIYDTRSKGIKRAPLTADSDLLRELVYKIIH